MSWEMVSLGDVAKLVTGKTPSTKVPEYFGGDFIWINPSDFGSKYIKSSNRTITQTAINDKQCNLLPKGTVLLSCIGDIGKVGILSKEGASNQQLTGLIVDETIYSSEFLYYYIVSKKLELENLANKAVVAILNNERLRTFQIPLPPLPIQKRIAEILDAADSLKRKDQELLKKYDELAQAIFIDMFGDPVKNEKGWEVKRFGDYIDYMGDIGSNGANAVISKNLKMLDMEDYALMVRTTNLAQNDFSKNVKFVSKETYDFFKKSKIYGGEIIMNKIGSAGDFWIMPNLDRPVSLGLNQLVIRVKELEISYLYYFLLSNYGQSQIKGRLNGAVTKSITKTAIKEFKLIYPSIELQKKFDTALSSINLSRNNILGNIQNSENLFNSLIQKAFKGELVS